MAVFPALLSAPLMMTYGYTPWLWVILGVAACHGITEAMLNPATQANVAQVAGEEDTAAAQGLAEAAGSGASAIGAFTAPVAFEAWGAGPAWVLAGAVMVVLVCGSWLLDPPRRGSVVGGASDSEPETLGLDPTTDEVSSGTR